MHLKYTKEKKEKKGNYSSEGFFIFTPYNVYIGDLGYWASLLWSRCFFRHLYCHIYDYHILCVIYIIYDIYGIYDRNGAMTYTIWLYIHMVYVSYFKLHCHFLCIKGSRIGCPGEGVNIPPPPQKHFTFSLESISLCSSVQISFIR